MDEDATIGELIRERRLAQGYSLGQLATKLGQTAAVVRGWEKGAENPDTMLLPGLAEALSLDTADLESLLPAAETPEQVSEPILEPAEAEHEASEAAAADQEAAEEAAEADEGSATEAVAQTAADDVADDEDDESGLVESGGAEDTAEEAAAGSEAAAATDPVPSSDDEDSTELGGETTSERDQAGPEDVSLEEQPTESIPAPVATERQPVQRRTGVVTDSRPVPAQAPEVLGVSPYKVTNPFLAFFDPKKRWLYYLRTALTIVVLFVLVRVFFWALAELWEAIQQVFESFRSTDEVEAVRSVS